MTLVPSDSLVEVRFIADGRPYTVRRYDTDANMYADARFYYKIWQEGREIDPADAPGEIVSQARKELAHRWAKFCEDNPGGRYHFAKEW